MHVDAWFDRLARGRWRTARSADRPPSRRWPRCGHGLHATPRRAGTGLARASSRRPMRELEVRWRDRDRPDARRPAARPGRPRRGPCADRRPRGPRRGVPLAVGRVHQRPPKRPGGRPGERVRDAGRRSRDARAGWASPRLAVAAAASASREVMDPELPMVSIVDLGWSATIEVGATPSAWRSCRRTSVARPSRSSERAVAERLAASRPSRSRSSRPSTPPWTSDRITRRRTRGPGAVPASRPRSRRRRSAARSAGRTRSSCDSLFGPTQCRSLFYCRGLPAAVRSHQTRSDRGRADPFGRRRGRGDDGRRHRPARPRGRP